MHAYRSQQRGRKSANLKVAALSLTLCAAGLMPSVGFADDGSAGSGGGYDWSGVYVGGLVGFNKGKDRTTEYETATGNPRNMFFDYDLKGFSGGAKVGANYQAGQFVFGAEADFELTNIDGTFIDRIEHLGRGDDSYDWQASIRARMGIAMDRVMIYGTGGLAAAKIKNQYTLVPFGITEGLGGTQTGWTAGAGVDYAVTNNVIAGIEWRYTRFDEYRNVSKSAFPGITGSQEPSFNSLRLSLSYKF